MEKAYIILAHKNIDQLVRLVKRLDDNSSTFFIHLDRRSTTIDLSALPGLSEKIHLVKRIDTHWAGFSLVQATLNAMHAIRAANKEFHMITLLSGQDYPIKSNHQIERFFKDSDKRVFIEYFKMPNYEKWSPGGGMYRLNKYFFGLKRHELFLSRSLNLLGRFFPFLRRSEPENLQPYAGSQWWTIDMYAMNYILDYVSGNPSYSVFHKATFAPDELFFQTILLNATDEKILNSIANENKRYIRWRSFSMSHPELLDEIDLHDIIKSDALFARKLDFTEHPGLFDMIDAHCLKKEITKA